MGVGDLNSTQVLVFWLVIHFQMGAQVYGHFVETIRGKICFPWHQNMYLLTSDQPSPTMEGQKQNTPFPPIPTLLLPSFLLLAPLKNCFLLIQAY